MKSEDENMELRDEAPILGAINKNNPFKTPEGYFKNLNAQILSQVKLSEINKNNNNFSVPPGYFESLSEQITSQISLDNFKTDQILSHGFEVPTDYFSDSKNRIIANVIKTPKKAKIIKLHFIRYAAAACILLTTTLGVYFNVRYNTAIDNQLAKIPAKEIEIYLNQHTDANDLPMLIENLDDDVNLNVDDFSLEKTD